MERSQILITGLGQCGCNFANLMKEKNGRYTPIFINSSQGDLKDLKHVNFDVNTFIYSGTDGSGRNRDKAEGFIQNDKLRLASFLKKYLTFKYTTVFFSTDGGTGSGTAKEYIQTIKMINPGLKVNVVAILPNLKEDSLQLKNSLACLQDLSKISDLINDIKFVNNNKGTNYNDINRRVVSDIDTEYSLIAHSSIGSIDEDNLANVASCKGYGVILSLPTNYSDLSEAFVTARENSVFSIPSVLECTYGAICVKDTDYKMEELLEYVSADETVYKSYNSKTNVICLGGCAMPYDEFSDIENELKERELNKKSSNRTRGFNYNSSVTKKNEKEEAKEDRPSFIDDDDLDMLLNANNFL